MGVVKEIEVKAKVTDIEAIKAKLTELGCVLSAPISQKDTIFVHADDTGIKSQRGRHIFRIRQQDNKNILTLKVHQSNELENFESEVTIDDPVEMRRMLGLLHFIQVVEVAKQRQKCKFKDWEICLDTVEGLGSYIEVEAFSSEDPLQVQDGLFEFLQSLGVHREDRETRGYDTLVRVQQEKQ